MRSHRHRSERVAALVQEALAETLGNKIKDPRVGFVTVTGVTVSPDNSHATVRVSVLGDEHEKAEALQGLESASGYLRSTLAQTLSLRITPELHFVLDRGIEHAARINRILDDLKTEADS
jgi:ribosome-binding factor A